MKPRTKVTRRDVRMTVPGEFADAVHDLAVGHGWSKKAQLRYFVQSGMMLVDAMYMRRAHWYLHFWEHVVVGAPDVAKRVMKAMDQEGSSGMVEALIGSVVVDG